jgi:hypothetical protein
MIVNDALGCTRRHRAHRSRDRAVPGLPGSLS